MAVHPGRGWKGTQTRSVHQFDTLKFVKRLEAEGFTPQQSEQVMVAMGDVIDESMRNLTRLMVTKEDQDANAFAQKVELAQLRSELQTMEKNDANKVRDTIERLTAEIDTLRQRIKEEITKTQAGVRLDLNLEKGRIRDEGSVHDLKIKETDTRIDHELANMRTKMQGIRFQVLQWVIGIITGAGALVLGMQLVFLAGRGPIGRQKDMYEYLETGNGQN
ncbi:Protein fmp32, mitochondrial [Saitoella coloradoensis]